MRLPVAIAVLITLAVASAHHTPQHTLSGPRFQPQRLYRYDVWYNVTSGVLGLSSQVSKAAFKAEVSIFAKDKVEHFLKIEKVYTSGSTKAVDGKHSDLPMEANSKLEDRLSKPITFNLVDGKVTKYTLSRSDNLESAKIKRSILRALEMHVAEEALQQIESDSEVKIPVTYNTTMATQYGNHSTHYLITVSPYAEFPADQDVYNITRSDDFEGERYPAYKVHHNFHQQGCPEVCRKDWKSNEYCAGCPMGYEPHHGPIKTSFNHEHHLTLTDGIMNPEIIRTSETHIAQMYDQDMEVLLLFQMRRKKVSSGTMVPPTGQVPGKDLHDWKLEINEKEIDEICRYKTSEESLTSVRNLLNDITEVVVSGNLESQKSKLVGQKLILLKNALVRLSVQDLDKVRQMVPVPAVLPSASQEDKVKRQIWLDVLPLIGTEESVIYIVSYIKESLNNDELMIWEAKEILESLPQNIHRPTERTVTELYSLITERSIEEKIRENHLLHSATHLCLARVIGQMCGNATTLRSSQPRIMKPWFSYRQAEESLEAQSGPAYGPPQCAFQLVDTIVKRMIEKLEKAKKKDDIAIYLETLAHIGVPEVLPTLAKYVYGTAHSLDKYSDIYTDFVQSVTLYALHNLAAKHPEQVLEIVLPVFFNSTENPKVRNAAFGVMIRCQPSLEILQHVAIKSWSEPSQEVGSYVTSTLETFGNSSMPCMQLTSHRIKKIMPHLKRFTIGVHHSKNLLYTYFDEHRELGLEGRLEYTQNNASFIPSALYKSLSYSTDSLRDVLMQMALNVQGLTYEKIWKEMEHYLNIKPMVPFPKQTEKEIFGDANINSRVPEAFRLTIYKRIFYCSSYYYLDNDNSRILKMTLAEYLRTYLKTSASVYDGYLVKMFLPSTYHTVAIARTLPFPVEFEMKQPLLLALKVKSREDRPSLKNFNMQFRPSIYFTRLFTNQIKNIGDCKEVGVYHEHKMAFTWPFDLEFRGFQLPNITLKYKNFELNKQVFTYFSESGTYAAKKSLESLPSTTEREPITTIPTPFKFEKKVNLVSIPPLHVQIHSEDIAWNIEKWPRSFAEAIEIVTKRVMNAGWRHKSLNVTLNEDSTMWPRDTEVTFKLQYYRRHFAKYLSQPLSSALNDEESFPNPEDSEWAPEAESWDSESAPQSWSWNDTPKDDDWMDYVKPSDIPSTLSPDVFIEQGKKAFLALSSVPHICHTWRVEVETKPLKTHAHIEIKYNHTYAKTFHTVHMDAAVKPTRKPQEYMITFDHAMAFIGKPNEFKYHKNGERQVAAFITAVGLPSPKTCGCGWENVKTVFKGKLDYKNLKEWLKKDLWTDVDGKYFLPETHEACIEDMNNGKHASISCLKAMRENSIYNHLTMTMVWKQNIPEFLKVIGKRADVYAKHILFHHLNITEERNTANRVMVELYHIDKLVDEPVFDVKIAKPDETIMFKRVPAGKIEPISSVYTIEEAAIMSVTNNSLPPTCIMMKDWVRTYDMREYKFSPEECSYVLSAHCARNKYFAVTVKGLENWHTGKGTKEVTLHIAKRAIVLTPESRSVYTIKVGSQEVPVTHPVVLDSTHDIFAYTEWTRGGLLLKVVAKRAGVSILYDGINVKVMVDPKYKGELCGLCSEFDGEILKEWKGVDECLYTHPLDFANSAITHKEGRCEKKMLEKKMCYGTEGSTKVWRGDNEGYEPTLKRNVVESRGSEYCFSTLPVPMCENNARPVDTEPSQVSFHCLPMKDVTAKKLIVEAKRRVLGELEGRSVDFEETMEVAKMC